MRGEKMVNLSTINKLRDKLINLYSPEKVYIFGSYAWGNPTEDSDLDILVITDKFEDLSVGKRISLATDILFDYEFPIDLIVESKKEFELSQLQEDSLESYIGSKGVVVYG